MPKVAIVLDKPKHRTDGVDLAKALGAGFKVTQASLWSLSKKIAKHLCTDGTGKPAEQLALKRKFGDVDDMGGWSMPSVARVIFAELSSKFLLKPEPTEKRTQS